MKMSSWYIITDCFSCTLAERARESRVPQACRRIAQKIEKDKKLKKIVRLEKQINLSRMKTRPLFFSVTGGVSDEYER